MSKRKVYFGGPLFSESEQMYNAKVVEQIRETFGERLDVYLPQENEAINDKSGYADSIMIANGDNEHLEESDILIAVIDGQVMDVGLASEIGYFYSMNKPIIAIYSDVRQGTHGNQEKIDALDEIAENQFAYANLYTIGLIKQRGVIVRGYREMLWELGTSLTELNMFKVQNSVDGLDGQTELDLGNVTFVKDTEKESGDFIQRLFREALNAPLTVIDDGFKHEIYSEEDKEEK